MRVARNFALLMLLLVAPFAANLAAAADVGATDTCGACTCAPERCCSMDGWGACKCYNCPPAV